MTTAAGALVRRHLAALETGDVEAAKTLWADDVVWHVPGRNRLSGTYRGKDEAARAVFRRGELTAGTIVRTVHDVVAGERHVVVLFTVRAERDGTTYAWNAAGVFEVRDGRIAVVWGLTDDQAAVDACFR